MAKPDNPPLRLEWRSPAELAENPKNWRRHPQTQLSALTDVIGEVGWAGACLYNERTSRLIDGHARRKVALDQGTTLIPVLVGDWSEADEAKILATLDPLAAMAEADASALDALLRDVQTSSAAVNEMLEGLAKANPQALPVAGAGGDEFDPTPDDGPTRTTPGDVWVIGGKHRLLVGDCTDAANVFLLMREDRAACVFTDPPYGVSVGAKNRLLNSVQKAGRCLTDIEDDDISPDDLKARLLPAFVNYRDHAMADDCTLLVCSPQGAELAMMMMMMKEAGVPPRHILIWKKNQPTFSMGRLDYDYQHEPILLTWGKRHKKILGGTFKTSIWEVDKPRASADHPTMKPVELYVNAYLNHSESGDFVADFYGGSGTAVIAAHRTNRLARVMEIEPRYADVILKRAEAEGLTVAKE